MPTFDLNFSRPGGQVVTQYYDFIRLGREGYARVHGATYETCAYLAHEIAKCGPSSWSTPATPTGASPRFRGSSPTASSTPSTCSTWPIAYGPTAGWSPPTPCRPTSRTSRSSGFVRHGFSRDMADLLLADIHRSLVTLDEHPPSS